MWLALFNFGYFLICFNIFFIGGSPTFSSLRELEIFFETETDPSKAPTLTVSPSFIIIFSNVPLDGEGTSTFTLSVVQHWFI